MTILSISIPDTTRQYIDEQVASGAYRSASDYLNALVTEDQERKVGERLEALLLDGLASGPATPMTDADWDDMRRRFDERHGSCHSR